MTREIEVYFSLTHSPAKKKTQNKQTKKAKTTNTKQWKLCMKAVLLPSCVSSSPLVDCQNDYLFKSSVIVHRLQLKCILMQHNCWKRFLWFDRYKPFQDTIKTAGTFDTFCQTSNRVNVQSLKWSKKLQSFRWITKQQNSSKNENSRVALANIPDDQIH